MSFLAPLVILGILVFVHELGHFIGAKRAGICVHELAFGMGPRLASFTAGETRYSLRLLPFGGFVRMATRVGRLPDDPPVPDQRAFESRSVATRLGVIAAGPAMSLLLAVVLMFAVFAVLGVEQPALDSTVIGAVLEGSPASTAGLRAGDRVLSLADQEVGTWNEMVLLIQARLGQRTVVVFERQGRLMETEVTPSSHPRDQSRGYLGVSSTVRTVRYGPLPAARQAVSETVRMLGVWVKGMAGMFQGGGAPDVSGPVGIIQVLGEASRFGLSSLCYLAAMISANFALINMLPIPALDGARLVFLGLEGVRGKPVPPEHEGRVHLVGYALLMALLVLLTYRDLTRLGGK